LSSYLIVDVGDLKTRVALIEERGGRHILRGVDEAGTTVEPPALDVNLGIEKAVENLEASTRLKFTIPEEAADRFLCTSSSGGGLHMIVAGLVSIMSAESGKRAALGAGAHLIDVFSIDDGRQKFQRVERMRALRPDMFLLTGGTDGGAVKQVVDMAEAIGTAGIKPRFGGEYKLPVVFAGNVETRDEISETLGEERHALKMVDNVRPVIERENLGPAREGIYNAYMEHIIIHSPGYGDLSKRVDERIIPSQAAIGEILHAYALERRVSLLGVDIGSATTDIYSVHNGVFNRSLNADLGMRYGLGNIMKEAGAKKILRWLPEEIGEGDLRDTLWNMMLRHADQFTAQENLIRSAAAREAIRLGFESHRTIASRLKGTRIPRTISDIFDQALVDSFLSDMTAFRVIVGRGRMLSTTSHMQAAQILVDGVQPEGVTEIYLDKLGLLPHLGILSRVDMKAAYQVLNEEGLTSLGSCIAPRGTSKVGEEVVTITLDEPDGSKTVKTLNSGEYVTIPLEAGAEADVEIRPTKRYDVGLGRGKVLNARVIGGSVGLIVDARGRPMNVYPRDSGISEWHEVPVTKVGEPNMDDGGH
jgi:uncharacterized protein (TIGR01319 family)